MPGGAAVCRIATLTTTGEPNPKATTGSKPPVLFVHGIFGRPRLLAPWTERFEAAGFECHAPSMPGRDPTDSSILRRSGVSEYVEAALAARERLSVPPVVVGHSFGGLLAQKLAARTETAALVLLASVPPGVLWPQPRSLPYLFPLLPAILAGRPIMPSRATLREVPLNTLPSDEAEWLIELMVPDSGGVFRSMTFGLPSMRVRRGSVDCPVLCVSGTADRNVSNAISRRIAARYRAEHQIHPGAPHWIVAESLADEVVPPVLDWLHGKLASA